MTKWEYRVVSTKIHGKFDQEALNILGEDGWELVGVGEGHFYLKRQKERA